MACSRCLEEAEELDGMSSRWETPFAFRNARIEGNSIDAVEPDKYETADATLFRSLMAFAPSGALATMR